ncbi:MAG: riboflavin synthase [Spirochaetaceae bacterium]|jgi:riboflavin synthase|nr:riboflavin synthase [Spirochaetaceae bacterium]
MFTGIVEEVGEVVSLERETGRARLLVRAAKALEGASLGDSISINGACQTVAAISGGAFSVWTLAESLKKTTLGGLRSGDAVNLERALRVDGRLGGHIVQGHVNAAVPIRSLRSGGGNVYLSVEIPPELRRYCVREGSVALDGASLTIADFADGLVSVNIIPATFEGTALKTKRAGDYMNLEVDILARYVESLLSGGGASGAFSLALGKERAFSATDNGLNVDQGLSAERLTELGF